MHQTTVCEKLGDILKPVKPMLRILSEFSFLRRLPGPYTASESRDFGCEQKNWSAFSLWRPGSRTRTGDNEENGRECLYLLLFRRVARARVRKCRDSACLKAINRALITAKGIKEVERALVEDK
jgi:hypothetical protein